MTNPYAGTPNGSGARYYEGPYPRRLRFNFDEDESTSFPAYPQDDHDYQYDDDYDRSMDDDRTSSDENSQDTE